MIEISKEEADYLRTRFRDINIVRTCRAKGNARRGKRYVEETRQVKKMLRNFYAGRCFNDGDDVNNRLHSRWVMCE